MGRRLLGRDNELARLVAACETGETLVTVTGPNGVGRSRLLEELVTTMSIDVVAIDDADALTEADLREAVASARKRSAPVVAVFSDGFAAPNTATRVHLDFLPVETVRVIAGHMGSDVSESTLAEIVSLADGDLGRLDAFVSDVVEGRDAGAGPRLGELTLRRARRLGDWAPPVVELVALLGSVPVDALESVGRDQLDRLERNGLVCLEHDEVGWMATLGSRLTADAVTRSLTKIRRVGLLRDFAGGLDAEIEWPETSDHPALDAYASADLDVPPAIRAARGQAEFAAFDFVAASAAVVPVAHTHWRAAFVLGWVARKQRDFPSAFAWFEVADALATTPTAITRIALSVAGLQAWQLLDVAAARHTVENAIKKIGASDGAWELRCEAAFLDTFLGQFDAAARTCRDILAEKGIDTLTTWNASQCLAYAQVTRANTIDLAPVLLRARDLVPAVMSEHPDSLDLHTALSVGHAFLEADVRGANALAFALITDDAAGIEDQRHGMTASIAIEALLVAADARVAGVAARSVDQLTRWDTLGELPAAQAALALAAACTDDLTTAAALIEKWDGPSNDYRARTLLGRASARLAAGADLDEAVHGLERAATTAADAGYTTAALLALVDAMWWPSVATRDAVVASLVSVAASASSPFATLAARLGHAAQRHDSAALESVADACIDAGADAVASLSFRLAAIDYGESVQARRAEARSLAIAAAAAPLLLPASPPIAGGVTRREIDIALRAAAGETSRTIAAETFLSTRTVDNHLRSVYEKLEVTGRDQLASLLKNPAS